MNALPSPTIPAKPYRGAEYIDIVKARAFDKIAAEPERIVEIIAATERRLAA